MNHPAIAQLNDLPATPCPCGTARRAFADNPHNAASVHLVDISEDARVHYHKNMTEIYVVIEGQGVIELDGIRYPIRPLSTVYIQPGCRHRAIGRMRLLNIPIPAFDPADEWFD
jgi:mannose-6-phosphate isomerase-like protein (cupin superfamily)